MRGGDGQTPQARVRRSWWTVRRRIAVSCLCCAVLPLVAYASYTYVRTARTLARLEAIRFTEREVAVGRALDDLTTAALGQSQDYASWGQLVDAVERGDNTWLRGQLESLAASPGAVAQIYAPDGRLLISSGTAASGRTLWRRSEAQDVIGGSSGEAPVAGFERLGDGLAVVSAQYIARPDTTGHPAGLLVVARPLDAESLTGIDAATDVHLSVAGEDAAGAAGGAAGSSASPAAGGTGASPVTTGAGGGSGVASGVLNQVGAPFDEGKSRAVYLAVYDADGYRAGLVKMAMDETAVRSATADLRTMAFVSLLLALLAATLAALLLSRYISRPLRRLASAAVAIAGGETRQTIEVRSGDEIGRLAGAFNAMSERVTERVTDLSGKLGSLTAEMTGLNVVFGETLSDSVDLGVELRQMLPHIAAMVKADAAALYAGDGGGASAPHAAAAAGGSADADAIAECISATATGLVARVRAGEDFVDSYDIVGEGGDAGLAGLAAGAEPGAAEGLGARQAEPGAAEGLGAGMLAGLAAAPVVHGDVRGALVVARHGLRPYDEQERALLTMLAGQLAVAVGNADTFRRLEAGYLTTVAALAGAIEVKDDYPPEHPKAVADVCELLAERLHLGEADRRLLRYGAILHDVGKIGVPERILRKAARLSDEEFTVMTGHTVIGESIVARIDYLRPVAPVIRAAHEHWDGTGYPDGLAGAAIPPAARIVCVGDAYVAMTSDRPYRTAMTHAAALEAIGERAGTHFDPEVAAALLDAGTSLVAAAHGGLRREPVVDRVLATVLFVDIVGSTARAAEIGDAAWKDELRCFYALVGDALKEYRGTLIDTAGDGVFARFDGAARAVRCALAIGDAVGSLGLRVRAGCHSGEIELMDGGVGGLAVHIGARVAALAGPGEVFVSGTVRDLVSGSGLSFTDRGEHDLKGVPGRWRVYASER